MPDTPLWQLSACDLAAKIAAGEVSSSDVVTQTVEHMRSVNPKLNAVVDDLGDEAIAQAKVHDEQLAKSGPIGPLHGVPVTIKENIDQTGRATPNGVEAYKNIIAPDDSPVVRNFKKAGAMTGHHPVARRVVHRLRSCPAWAILHMAMILAARCAILQRRPVLLP